MDLPPLSFIDEPIEVIFEQPPVLIKSPTCPAAFVWRGEVYAIVEEVGSWADYRRRGKAAHNMRPAHLSMAAQRGSWGVGRFYFRVQVSDGRVFDLYYDRAPQDAADRGGHWYLWGQRGQRE